MKKVLFDKLIKIRADRPHVLTGLTGYLLTVPHLPSFEFIIARGTMLAPGSLSGYQVVPGRWHSYERTTGIALRDASARGPTREKCVERMIGYLSTFTEESMRALIESRQMERTTQILKFYAEVA